MPMVWVDANSIHSGRIRCTFGLIIAIAALSMTEILLAVSRRNRTVVLTVRPMSSSATSAAYQAEYQQLIPSKRLRTSTPVSYHHRQKRVAADSEQAGIDACPLPTVENGLVLMESVPVVSTPAFERTARYKCGNDSNINNVFMHCSNGTWSRSGGSCQQPGPPTEPTPVHVNSPTNKTAQIATAARGGLDSSGLSTFAIVGLALIGSGTIVLLAASYYFYDTSRQTGEAEILQAPELTLASITTTNDSIIGVPPQASAMILNRTTPFADMIKSDESIINNGDYTLMSPPSSKLYDRLNSVRHSNIKKDERECDYIDQSDVSPKLPRRTKRCAPTPPSILQMHGSGLPGKTLAAPGICHTTSMTSIRQF